MVVEPRRALDRIRPASPNGCHYPAGLLLGHLSAAPASAASTTASRSRRRTSSSRSRRIKKASPRYAFYYKNVVKAEKTGDRQVTFPFDVKGNRELPMIIGELPILPKHYWEGTGANGEPRDLAQVDAGDSAGLGPLSHQGAWMPAAPSLYERVKDWWAKDLPVPRASGTSTRSSFVYFRDRDPAFEAFKAGELDYWREIERQVLGHAVRLRRGQARAGEDGPLPVAQRRADAGVRLQHSPSAVPGPARAAAPSTWPSISSGPTRTCSTTSTSGSAATSRTPS